MGSVVDESTQTRHESPLTETVSDTGLYDLSVPSCRPLPRQHRGCSVGERRGPPRRGVDAKLVVFNRYKLHPEADRSLERRGGFVRRQATQWRALLAAPPDHRRLPLLLRPHARTTLGAVPDPARAPEEVGHALPRVRHPGKTPAELAFGRKAAPSSSAPTTRSAGCPRRRWSRPASTSRYRARVPGRPTARDRRSFTRLRHVAAREPRRARACEGLEPTSSSSRASPRRGFRALPRGRHRRRPAERRLVRPLRDRVHGARKPVVTFLHEEARRAPSKSSARASRS